MQSWQLFPIVIVAAVLGYTAFLRKKLGRRAAALYGNAMTTLRQAVATGASPGEAAPICVVATERKLLSARVFYIGLTDRRLVLHEPGAETRAFDRRAVQLAIKEKTWSDSGNMTTTISRGWELVIVLPDGMKYACRVYAEAHGIPEHPQSVQALLRAA